MPRTIEWEIPAEIQPKPEDCAFDLDRALGAVLGLHATVPEDAFTAGTLGTERAGSGVLIRKDGLVLTIGYLITEAESIWLTSSVGGAVPGHVLGYDQETGFGLVQALGRLSVSPIELGTGRRVGAGDRAIIAAEGGRRHAIAATVVARQEFAGHWEYLLDRAIFTAPAPPFRGRAGVEPRLPVASGVGERPGRQRGRAAGRARQRHDAGAHPVGRPRAPLEGAPAALSACGGLGRFGRRTD